MQKAYVVLLEHMLKEFMVTTNLISLIPYIHHLYALCSVCWKEG